VVVYRDLLDRRRLAAIGERVIAALDAPIPFDGTPCRVSASIGITTSDLYARPDAGQMLRDADIALYRSKNAGRSRVTFFRDGAAPEAVARDLPALRIGSGPG
jgi:GGDEF domain-containing protein